MVEDVVCPVCRKKATMIEGNKGITYRHSPIKGVPQTCYVVFTKAERKEAKGGRRPANTTT